MKNLTPATIYAAAVETLPACDIDHHASDFIFEAHTRRRCPG